MLNVHVITFSDSGIDDEVFKSIDLEQMSSLFNPQTECGFKIKFNLRFEKWKNESHISPCLSPIPEVVNLVQSNNSNVQFVHILRMYIVTNNSLLIIHLLTV